MYLFGGNFLVRLIIKGALLLASHKLTSISIQFIHSFAQFIHSYYKWWRERRRFYL